VLAHNACAAAAVRPDPYRHMPPTKRASFARRTLMTGMGWGKPDDSTASRRVAEAEKERATAAAFSLCACIRNTASSGPALVR